MSAIYPTPPGQDSSDEELVLQLAAGRQDPLGPLYSRYAPLIFTLAAPRRLLRAPRRLSSARPACS